MFTHTAKLLLKTGFFFVLIYRNIKVFFYIRRDLSRLPFFLEQLKKWRRVRSVGFYPLRRKRVETFPTLWRRRRIKGEKGGNMSDAMEEIRKENQCGESRARLKRTRWDDMFQSFLQNCWATSFIASIGSPGPTGRRSLVTYTKE